VGPWAAVGPNGKGPHPREQPQAARGTQEEVGTPSLPSSGRQPRADAPDLRV